MLNLRKIFRGEKQDYELLKKDSVESNPMEQNKQNSEEQLCEPPSVINKGQVTIRFTGVSHTNGALLVGFFVSNGLSHKVKFDKVSLVLIDSDRRVLARQSFDKETLGEIAGGSEKACVVRFLSDNVYVKDVPAECQVCFDVPAESPKRIKITYQALPENITKDQQRKLERLLRKLPPVQHGEVNFSPLHAQITTQRNLLATVIIRNSTDEIINLKQIPLAVFDAHQEELARGKFDINDLSIKPLKAILWTFNFGSISQDRDIDLSTWHITPIQ